MDGRETVGNSLGRARVGRSDTGVTTGWTEGKPWEIAWGELRWEGAMRSGGKERYRSDDRVDGRETVGNSLGRAPVGRSDTGMTTGWTEGKPWEIARGEFRGEGAIRKRQEGGRGGNRGK